MNLKKSLVASQHFKYLCFKITSLNCFERSVLKNYGTKRVVEYVKISFETNLT